MASQNPAPRKRPNNVLQQVGMAMELPFLLIVGVLLGGGGGYLIDHWLHTAPAFMLVCGLLGFGIGFWDILKRLKRGETNQGSGNGGG